MPTSGINIEAFNLGCAVHKLLWYKAVPFFGGELRDADTIEGNALLDTVLEVSKLSPTASASANNQMLAVQLRQMLDSFLGTQRTAGFSDAPDDAVAEGHQTSSSDPSGEVQISDTPPLPVTSGALPSFPSGSALNWPTPFLNHFEMFRATIRKDLLYAVTQLAVTDLAEDEKQRWRESFNFGYMVDNVVRPVESARDLLDVIKVTDQDNGKAVSFSVIDRENTPSDKCIAWKPLQLQDAARNDKRYWVVEYSKTSVTASNEDELAVLHQLTNLPAETRYEEGRRSVPEWMLVVRRDAPPTTDSGERALADRFNKLTGIQLGKCPHTESSAVADWYAEVVTLTEIYRVNRIDGSSRFMKCGDADRPQLKLGNLCVRSLKREAKPQSWVMDQLDGKTILEACGGLDVADSDMSWDQQRSAFSDFASEARKALPSLNFSCKVGEANKSGRVTMTLAFLPQPDDVPPRS